MKNDLVLLDGVNYNVGVEDIERNFEVADTDASGRTADWAMHRDVVGTFYNYTVKFFMQSEDRDAYNRFYEAISAPVPSHVLTVPYGAGSMTFNAYVSKGKDKLFHKNRRTGAQTWDDLSINFVAMEPQRKA